MATLNTNRLMECLRKTVLQDGTARTDGQLLNSFVDDKDAAALAALVRRHGPMVWGVCSRMLGNHQDAEDAFQASFLVFVQKAPTLPDKEMVGNWLYGVAHQTAVRVRALVAKRGAREKQVEVMPEAKSSNQYVWNDLKAVLDEELACLPDKYRTLIVLCDLEGKTRKEVARQLAIPEGTVASRLATARSMLAKRLSRRGIVISGALLGTVLSSQAASAGVPTAVIPATIKAATLVAAGQAATAVISPTVAAVTEGVMKAMVLNQIKSALTVILVILGLGLATFGLGVLADGGPNHGIVNEHDGNVEKPMDVGQQPAQPKQQPAKTDQERMVGNWFITNEDSLRQGEMWVIYDDSILMYAKHLGLNAQTYFHRVDAGKNPKQIDITVKRVNGPTIGVIKGIYVLDGDELRVSLAAMDKDRPAAFPIKPGPGEVLVLRRQKFVGQQTAKSDQERMVGEWFIKNADSKRQGELWVIHKDHILMNYYGPGLLARQYHFLDAGKDPKQIDITFTQANGPNAIKGIYVLDGDELRLCLGARGKDRPAAFPVKPEPGEVLILQRAAPGGGRPKAKGGTPDAKKVLTPEEAIKQMPKENVTVQFKVASVEQSGWYTGYPATYYVHLKDGGKFTAWLNAHYPSFNNEDQILKLVKKLGIKSVTDLSGKVVRVTGRIDESGLRMWVHDPANNVEVVKPKTDGKDNEQKPNEEKRPKAKEDQPAKSDEDRLVGGWVITSNDGDRNRKGELWSIGKHQIVMNANLTGFRGISHFHRLDATKNPKQIDITVTGIAGTYGPDVPIKADARIVGVIKGIYTLTDDNELRLCLGEMDKDRPTAFAAKAGQSELLILRGGTWQPPVKPAANAAWSEAVEGLQCWLQADKAVWKVDEVPTFRLHVRNQGKRDHEIHMAQAGCKLELDGVWFDWNAPVSILSGPWPAGHQYDDFEVRVTLEAPWAKDNQPIAVKPGKHKIRVAYVTLDRKKPVSVVSNAVEIQVAAEQPKAKDEQPRNDTAQRLLAKWQHSARTDGKIPGALIGQLALNVDAFVKQYPDDKNTPTLAKLRPRIDASKDWPQAEAAALLDDIASNSTAPLGWTDLKLTLAEMRNFKKGQPLPDELKTAAWGAPEKNGLRAAWLLEPIAKEYAGGTVLKARVLFHNAGKDPVVFTTETWHQWDEHKARDANGMEIKIARGFRTGLTPKVTYRLAPGEYGEVLGHTIGIGAGAANIAATAGDEVTLTHRVDATFATQSIDPEVWKKSIAARVEREGPMPKAAADREQLIRRVMLDLFGVPASAKEMTAFVGDNAPEALANLTASLQAKPRIEPWAGKLPTGETKFRVTAAEAK